MIDTLIQNNAASPASGIDVIIDGAPTVTKLLSAVWAAGSGVGCLDQGAVVAGGSYHGFLIQNMGTNAYDAIFSASATAPLVPTGWVALGEPFGAVVLDASGVIRPFVQAGDFFRYKIPIRDYTGQPNGPNATLRTLSVPLGKKMIAKLLVDVSNTGNAGGYICAFDADLGPLAIEADNCSFIRLTGASEAAAQLDVWTNAAGQIYTGDNASGTSTITTILQGFRYPRHAV